MEIIPTPYNQLRQLLTDRLPHLKELSFGCEIEVFGIANDNPGCQYDAVIDSRVKDNSIRTGYYGNVPLTDFKIIGHPPTLQDILLALKEVHATNNDLGICLDLGGSEILVLTKDPISTKQSIPYDLTKPLADQTDETLLALIGLVK